MARAQASTEFIIIMSISFIVLLVLSTMALEYLFSVRSQRDYGDAQSAVQTLAEEADNVYAQGTGAEKIVKITLPSTALFSPNATYIGRPLNSSAGKSNTIAIDLNGTVVSAITTARVVGEFPSYAGVHHMRVTSYGNFVSIGSHLVSVSPTSVFLSINKNGTDSSVVTFNVAFQPSANDSVNVSLSSSWAALTNISPSSFSSFGFTDVPVTLTFFYGTAGIYTSTLNVTAARQSANGSVTARETFSVPLTLEVLSG